MTMPNHDERCRQLAELDDPRFAALRGKHEIYEQLYAFCRGCDWGERSGPKPTYCLRKDADALLECAAACAWNVSIGPAIDTSIVCVITRSWGAVIARANEAVAAEAISAALWQAEVGAR